MDKLFDILSQHLSKTTRIEIYSLHNQYLLDNSDIVLWDKSATSISSEVYIKLKDALNKRSCSFYGLTKVLPYHDFCIALLCSVGYSLNHNTMPVVGSRTFRSAWRAISVVKETSNDIVIAWIKDRIQDRDATKYNIVFNIGEDSPTISRRIPLRVQPDTSIIDSDIISKACSSRDVNEIDINSEFYTLINKVTGVPECQLDSLRIIHSELIGKNF